jgi:hypothetical protein
MSNTVDSLISVGTAIVGLAVVAVLVSKNADTGTVVTSAGTAFATAIGAAVSPVTGSSTSGLTSLSSIYEPG